ncbi:MAG TPA: DUF2868 domain-containing protein [Noviherbaspirillum sp.]
MSGNQPDRPVQSHALRFDDLLIAEAVRAIEHEGPLEDEAEMRDAFRFAESREARLLERARLLGQRLRLDLELRQWREMAWVVWLGLAVLAFLAAYGIAAAIVGSGRSVNAVTAFFALLAMPSMTLLVWLVAVLSNGGTGLFARLSFGSLLLALLARIPGTRNPHALTMARSAAMVLQRARLLPWAFGFVSHAVWAAAFVLILAALWFAFSFQQYRLTWETTILHPGFFVRFVTFTGALPHVLGFPLPDTATLLDPAAASSDHRAWAWWLIGCACVYGLLPRLVLAVLCWAVWWRGVRRMHLDTSEPYYRKLLARFDAMEQSTVVDREHRAGQEVAAPSAIGDETGIEHAVIGFELPPELAWPPQPLPHAALIERIAGAAHERRALLDKLAVLRPRALLVVCHAASSPDRGTERFLREAARHARHTGLLFATADAATEDAGGVQRWRAWLQQTGLEAIVHLTDAAQAAAWLEGAHD